MVAAVAISWALAAWASRTLGLWLAVGPTAVGLSLVALATGSPSVPGDGRHGRALALGAIAGVAMAAVTTVLFDPVTSLWPALRDDAARLYASFASPGRMATILLLPVVVSGEELVWRGAMYRALSERLGSTWAVPAGTLLYAATLVPTGSPVLVLTAAGAGFCWTVLRARTHSVLAPLAAHLAWDYAVVVMQQLTSPV
jgi:membrane protease YdiL (CAAX protease family)